MNVEPTDSTPDLRVWRTSGGDNSRRGLFIGEPRSAGHPGEPLPADAAVHASVVFDNDGSAFVADMSGTVQAFDPSAGSRWRVRLANGVSATPAVDSKQGRLYVGTHGGWVHALATATGHEVWRQHIPSSSDARILSDLLHLPGQGLVVLSSWGGRFHALDTARGQERFSCDAGISPSAGAAADSRETIYALRAVRDKGVQFLRLDPGGSEKVLTEESGRQRDARRTVVLAAPVLDEARGRAYFIVNVDRQSVLHSYAFETGTIVWTHRFSHGTAATPCLCKEGPILVASLDGTLHAIGADGTLLYRYVSGCEYLLAGPVCDDRGHAYLAAPDGLVHQVDNRGVGRPLFEARRSFEARPSFNPNGHLCLPCTDRSIYRLSLPHP
jgi:outer membrane protein assembly factor BamB